MSATAIAAEVRAGRRTARSIAIETLDRIAAEGALNAATRLLRDRALADAARVDAMVAAGQDPGPLAGVPFAVKDLFDVAGEPTTAGARQLAAAPPAARDAEVVARLCAAGAVLVATTNMDEFAYGFSTENAHFGTTRNPHDPERLAGGSSGGSAALVGAGLVPLALGSDTNGSIRVPASLCGVFGLRPTFGAVPVAGVYPFVDRLDTVGCFTRSSEDMAIAHAVMTGAPLSPGGSAIVRVAPLGGWFAERAEDAVLTGIDRIARHLHAGPPVVLHWAAAARSAGFMLTGAEGGHRHLPALRRDAMAFDAGTRDRLIAGALQPVAAVREAEAVAARFTDELLEALATHDLLLAPATPMAAPRIDATTIVIDGQSLSARADLGLHTQPLSLAGVPILSVPLAQAGAMPIGVQLIAAPGRETLLFDTAAELVAAGLVACPVAPIAAVAA